MISDMKPHLFLLYIFITVHELYITGPKATADFCLKRSFYVDLGFIYSEVPKPSTTATKRCNEHSGFIYRNPH